ncbi:unnamed protein product [Amoebophrya sp. A120]|nr:unnamed protein product [Amoebophrya sp. A120]|eukprot:GSA120T00015874001.1
MNTTSRAAKMLLPCFQHLSHLSSSSLRVGLQLCVVLLLFPHDTTPPTNIHLRPGRPHDAKNLEEARDHPRSTFLFVGAVRVVDIDRAGWPDEVMIVPSSAAAQKQAEEEARRAAAAAAGNPHNMLGQHGFYSGAYNLLQPVSSFLSGIFEGMFSQLKRLKNVRMSSSTQFLAPRKKVEENQNTAGGAASEDGARNDFLEDAGEQTNSARTTSTSSTAEHVARHPNAGGAEAEAQRLDQKSDGVITGPGGRGRAASSSVEQTTSVLEVEKRRPEDGGGARKMAGPPADVVLPAPAEEAGAAGPASPRPLTAPDKLQADDEMKTVPTLIVPTSSSSISSSRTHFDAQSSATEEKSSVPPASQVQQEEEALTTTPSSSSTAFQFLQEKTVDDTTATNPPAQNQHQQGPEVVLPSKTAQESRPEVVDPPALSPAAVVVKTASRSGTTTQLHDQAVSMAETTTSASTTPKVGRSASAEEATLAAGGSEDARTTTAPPSAGKEDAVEAFLENQQGENLKQRNGNPNFGTGTSSHLLHPEDAASTSTTPTVTSTVENSHDLPLHDDPRPVQPPAAGAGAAATETAAEGDSELLDDAPAPATSTAQVSSGPQGARRPREVDPVEQQGSAPVGELAKFSSSGRGDQMNSEAAAALRKSGDKVAVAPPASEVGGGAASGSSEGTTSARRRSKNYGEDEVAENYAESFLNSVPAPAAPEKDNVKTAVDEDEEPVRGQQKVVLPAPSPNEKKTASQSLAQLDDLRSRGSEQGSAHNSGQQHDPSPAGNTEQRALKQPCPEGEGHQQLSEGCTAASGGGAGAASAAFVQLPGVVLPEKDQVANFGGELMLSGSSGGPVDKNSTNMGPGGERGSVEQQPAEVVSGVVEEQKDPAQLGSTTTRTTSPAAMSNNDKVEDENKNLNYIKLPLPMTMKHGHQAGEKADLQVDEKNNHNDLVDGAVPGDRREGSAAESFPTEMTAASFAEEQDKRSATSTGAAEAEQGGDGEGLAATGATTAAEAPPAAQDHAVEDHAPRQEDLGASTSSATTSAAVALLEEVVGGAAAAGTKVTTVAPVASIAPPAQEGRREGSGDVVPLLREDASGGVVPPGRASQESGLLPGVVEGEEQVGVGDQTAVASLVQKEAHLLKQSRSLDDKVAPPQPWAEYAQLPPVIVNKDLQQETTTYWRATLPKDVYDAIVNPVGEVVDEKDRQELRKLAAEGCLLPTPELKKEPLATIGPDRRPLVTEPKMKRKKMTPVMQYQQIGTPEEDWRGVSETKISEAGEESWVPDPYANEENQKLLVQLAVNNVNSIDNKPKLFITFGNTGTGKSLLAERMIEMAGLTSSDPNNPKVEKFLVDDLVEPQEVFKVLGWVFLNAAGHDLRQVLPGFRVEPGEPDPEDTHSRVEAKKSVLEDLVKELEGHIKLRDDYSCASDAVELLTKTLPKTLRNAGTLKSGQVRRVPRAHDAPDVDENTGEWVPLWSDEPLHWNFGWDLIWNLAMLHDERLYPDVGGAHLSIPKDKTGKPQQRNGKGNYWWDYTKWGAKADRKEEREGKLMMTPAEYETLSEKDSLDKGYENSVAWTKRAGPVRRDKTELTELERKKVEQELEGPIGIRLSHVATAFRFSNVAGDTGSQSPVQREYQRHVLERLVHAMDLTYKFSRYCGFATNPKAMEGEKSANDANDRYIYERIKQQKHALIENNQTPLGIIEWLRNPPPELGAGVAEAFHGYEIWLGMNLVEKEELWGRMVARSLGSVTSFTNPFTAKTGPRLPAQANADAWIIRNPVSNVLKAIETGEILTKKKHRLLADVRHFIVVDNNGSNGEDRLLAAVDLKTGVAATAGPPICTRDVTDVMGLPLQWELMDVISRSLHREFERLTGGGSSPRTSVTLGLDTAFLCRPDHDYSTDLEIQSDITASAFLENHADICGAENFGKRLPMQVTPLHLTQQCKAAQDEVELEKQEQEQLPSPAGEKQEKKLEAKGCWEKYCGFESRYHLETNNGLKEKMQSHIRIHIAAIEKSALALGDPAEIEREWAAERDKRPNPEAKPPLHSAARELTEKKEGGFWLRVELAQLQLERPDKPKFNNAINWLEKQDCTALKTSDPAPLPARKNADPPGADEQRLPSLQAEDVNGAGGSSGGPAGEPAAALAAAGTQSQTIPTTSSASTSPAPPAAVTSDSFDAPLEPGAAGGAAAGGGSSVAGSILEPAGGAPPGVSSTATAGGAAAVTSRPGPPEPDMLPQAPADFLPAQSLDQHLHQDPSALAPARVRTDAPGGGAGGAEAGLQLLPPQGGGAGGAEAGLHPPQISTRPPKPMVGPAQHQERPLAAGSVAAADSGPAEGSTGPVQTGRRDDDLAAAASVQGSGPDQHHRPAPFRAAVGKVAAAHRVAAVPGRKGSSTSDLDRGKQPESSLAAGGVPQLPEGGARPAAPVVQQDPREQEEPGLRPYVDNNILDARKEEQQQGRLGSSLGAALGPRLPAGAGDVHVDQEDHGIIGQQPPRLGVGPVVLQEGAQTAGGAVAGEPAPGLGLDDYQLAPGVQVPHQHLSDPQRVVGPPPAPRPSGHRVAPPAQKGNGGKGKSGGAPRDAYRPSRPGAASGRPAAGAPPQRRVSGVYSQPGRAAIGQQLQPQGRVSSPYNPYPGGVGPRQAGGGSLGSHPAGVGAPVPPGSSQLQPMPLQQQPSRPPGTGVYYRQPSTTQPQLQAAAYNYPPTTTKIVLQTTPAQQAQPANPAAQPQPVASPKPRPKPKPVDQGGCCE